MARTRHLLFAIAFAAPATLLLGCSPAWHTLGHDAQRTAHQRKEVILNSVTVSNLHVVWDFSVPGGGSLTASPSVDENTIYVGSINGFFYGVYATGPNQGKLRWQYPPATPPSPPDACGTTTAPLLIGSGSGNPSGPGIASSAAIVEHVAGHHHAVIFGAPDPNSNSGDGRLWALDARTGKCLWKSTVIAPTSGTSKIGYSSPAIAHDRAYVGVSAKRPDDPIAVGQIFAIHLSDGTQDTGFKFLSVGGFAPGGGIWSSPSVSPLGDIIVTTGNSCMHETFISPNCTTVPSPDYTNSILKLDWQTGNVLWQIQPVAVQHDLDPDFAASANVGHVSCGTLAIAVQKDGYVYAADVKSGGFSSNPACSYAGHNLECPHWAFPPAPSLPFQDDNHGDSQFKREGALDRERLFIASGGYDLEPPPMHSIQQVYNRLHSLDVCANDANRIRWILPNLSDNAGGVSVANGIVYLGTWTPFDTSASPHQFYVIQDAPSSTVMCSYPGLPPGAACTGAGFHDVPVPIILVPNAHNTITLTGSIQAVPAISGGRVYVATAGGHLYALGL
jgi:outer membrane protein assembly factor BamB